jgi:hypothetical protein
MFGYALLATAHLEEDEHARGRREHARVDRHGGAAVLELVAHVQHCKLYGGTSHACGELKPINATAKASNYAGSDNYAT